MARSLKDCACDYKSRCDCPEAVPVKKIFTGDPSNPHNAKCLICLTGDTVVRLICLLFALSRACSLSFYFFVLSAVSAQI